MVVARNCVCVCVAVYNIDNNEWLRTVFSAGGLGQLGIECAKLLRSQFGDDSVLLSDIIKPNKSITQSGPYIFADILDFKVRWKWKKYRRQKKNSSFVLSAHEC